MVRISCLDGAIANAVGIDDPFYFNSWQLENTGPTQLVSASSNAGLAGIDANVKSVHLNGNGCTGKGITIAILDSGLELAHEDLAPNVLVGRSFNFANNTTDPSPAPNQTSVDHGTGVATIDPNCNYTGQINGTSAAAPSISGVVALMFEANPSLTWQDVGFILAKTARKIDADIATGARATSFTAAGKLDLDLPWQTNSAGFNFQNRYGFGMIDADAAVKLAKAFAAPAGRRATDLVAAGAASAAADSGGGKYTVNSAAVTFADAAAVTGQMRVELELTNGTGAAVNPGMVQFELVNNKSGQVSVLLPAFTSWHVGGKTNLLVNNGKQKFRLHTNAFYGEKLGDGYTVRVTYVKSAQATSGNLAFTSSLTSFSL